MCRRGESRGHHTSPQKKEASSGRKKKGTCLKRDRGAAEKVLLEKSRVNTN